MLGHYTIIIVSTVPTCVVYFLLAIKTDIRTDKLVRITSTLFPPTFMLLTFFFDNRSPAINFGIYLLFAALLSAFLYFTMPYGFGHSERYKVMDKTRERWKKKYKKN